MNDQELITLYNEAKSIPVVAHTLEQFNFFIQQLSDNIIWRPLNNAVIRPLSRMNTKKELAEDRKDLEVELFDKAEVQKMYEKMDFG